MFSAHTASMRNRGPRAVPTPPGSWISTGQSFRFEVPCDISCDSSWLIGGNHGESRPVTRADASRSEAQTRRSQAYDLRLSWWPGAGSNRRPSDFQSEIRNRYTPMGSARLSLSVCCPVVASSLAHQRLNNPGCEYDSADKSDLSRDAGHGGSATRSVPGPRAIGLGGSVVRGGRRCRRTGSRFLAGGVPWLAGRCPSAGLSRRWLRGRRVVRGW